MESSRNYASPRGSGKRGRHVYAARFRGLARDSIGSAGAQRKRREAYRGARVARTEISRGVCPAGRGAHEHRGHRAGAGNIGGRGQDAAVARASDAARSSLAGIGRSLVGSFADSKGDKTMVVKCEDVWREISNYFEGDLDPALKRAMEEHLAQCPHCESVRDGMRNVIEL